MSKLSAEYSCDSCEFFDTESTAAKREIDAIALAIANGYKGLQCAGYCRFDPRPQAVDGVGCARQRERKQTHA